MLVSMVAALPKNFMPNRDHAYYEGKQKESTSLAVVDILLTTRERRTFERVPVARIMVDNGAAMNILPASLKKILGKSIEDLIRTDIVVSSFTAGATDTWGILPVEVTVGS
ncbi:hypothetical protein ACH5RR_006758 [Cinchona calisaya]|uniref:Peptidase A2 domain-containing protein n=1 Tax=Cinchona calisaya TaxID=153742 RepID=A0ABD3APW6_9GENT